MFHSKLSILCNIGLRLANLIGTALVTAEDCSVSSLVPLCELCQTFRRFGDLRIMRDERNVSSFHLKRIDSRNRQHYSLNDRKGRKGLVKEGGIFDCQTIVGCWKGNSAVSRQEILIVRNIFE